MKCIKEKRTSLLISKCLNIFLLISFFLFFTFTQENLSMVKSIKLTLKNSGQEMSNHTHHNHSIVIKNETHVISIRKTNEKTKIEINFPSQNITIIPAQITDKVDMDIKKLDIKLEKLSQMIEKYEKSGNSSNSEKISKHENDSHEAKKMMLNFEDSSSKNVTQRKIIAYRKDNSVKIIFSKF
jgi:hypothetical protein